MTIRELLSDESKWTQRAPARNEAGELVGPQDSDAVCWCLWGAVIKTRNIFQRTDVINSIHISTGQNVADWNDTHTFKDVRELIERLEL